MTRLKVIGAATPVIPARPARLFLSRNSKTGLSINVAIARTCQPTRGCATYCYGLTGRLTFGAALRTQAANAAFFEQSSPAQLVAEATRVGRRVLRRQRFIRVFGVGDLQQGSVAFIASLAGQFPDLAVWVSTRKLALAERLPALPNLHVMTSLDTTTPAVAMARTMALARERPRQFFPAWTRRSEDEKVPAGVKIVFEEHALGRGRAAWAPEPRACPATVAGGAEHDGACARCGFCFDARKREAGPALLQLRRKR